MTDNVCVDTEEAELQLLWIPTCDSAPVPDAKKREGRIGNMQTVWGGAICKYLG